MKIHYLLIALIVAIPCYARKAAPVVKQEKAPATPSPQQKKEAKDLIRTFLPKEREADIKSLEDTILAQAWSDKSSAYNKRKIQSKVRELFGLRVEREPVPLDNPNNTCFMNGAIQAVYQIEPLINFLLENRDLYTSDVVASSFIEVFSQMRKGYVGQKDLSDAYETITAAVKRESGAPFFAQGDPHEFMGPLLNSFRSAKERFLLTGASEKEFLPESLFEIKTKQGNYPEAREYDLLLAIPPDLRKPPKTPTAELPTVKDLIERYFDENTHITEAPREFIFLLKRVESFPGVIIEEIQQIPPGFDEAMAKALAAGKPAPKIPTVKRERVVTRTPKITNTILIPMRMSLREFFDPAVPGNGWYRLKSAICHLGVTGSGGHYVSYVQTPRGEWFYTNDDEIDPKTRHDIRDLEERGYVRENALPYILIYEAERPVSASERKALLQKVLEQKKEEEEKVHGAVEPRTIFPARRPLTPTAPPLTPPAEESEGEGEEKIKAAAAEVEEQLPLTEIDMLKAELKKARALAAEGGDAGKKAVKEIRRLNFEIKRLQDRAGK